MHSQNRTIDLGLIAANLGLHSVELLDPLKYQRMVCLVTYAFGADTRPNGKHFLSHVGEVVRVTHQLLRNYPEATLEQGLIAACGHDLLEDKAKMFGGARNLKSQIREQFGPEVLKIIELLTNPHFPKDISEKEKRRLYHEHVREKALSTSISRAIKFADFLSNTDHLRSLYESGEKEKARRLARKYLPLFPDFLKVHKEFGGGNETKARLELNKKFAKSILSAT